MITARIFRNNQTIGAGQAGQARGFTKSWAKKKKKLRNKSTRAKSRPLTQKKNREHKYRIQNLYKGHERRRNALVSCTKQNQELTLQLTNLQAEYVQLQVLSNRRLSLLTQMSANLNKLSYPHPYPSPLHASK